MRKWMLRITIKMTIILKNKNQMKKSKVGKDRRKAKLSSTQVFGEEADQENILVRSERNLQASQQNQFQCQYQVEVRPFQRANNHNYPHLK